MLKAKLQKLQNRAAIIMTGANYDIRSTDLLHAMSWKNLNDRHKMNKSVLMFKILNNHSAPNLKDKFITRDINLSTNYNLRNADINLSVPKPRTEYLKKSFGYSVHSQKRHRLAASCGFYRPAASCQQVAAGLLTSSTCSKPVEIRLAAS